MKNDENAQSVYTGYGMDLEALLDEIMDQEAAKHPFFVVGKAFGQLRIEERIKSRYPQAVFFKDFLPNPTYESVMAGRELFRQYASDILIAMGGGSAIDVAKCIKAYAFMEGEGCLLPQAIRDNEIKIVAIPTTAGTGSEATHFAVIYYQGKKQSVSHESLLPAYVILDGKYLESLPDYQRKATMLDALCHSIESLWSVNSTEESKEYAVRAIELLMQHKLSYLRNEKEGNLEMMRAANLAGKAINITKTTAAHAMSYKMTSLFGISHGHSAALCLPKVWRYMICHMDQCVDKRGKDYLDAVFTDIGRLLGCDSPEEAAAYLEHLIEEELELRITNPVTEEEMAQLVHSVNVERLANNPVVLDEAALAEIYREVLKGGAVA